MAKSLHSPEYEHFRLLMITAREKKGLTQSDIALTLGRPQSFVSKYESGERRLDMIEFIQVCLALGIDPKGIIADIQSWMNKNKKSKR